LNGRDDICYDRLFLVYASDMAETVSMVREEVAKYARFDQIIETRAGCTICSHCGPGTLGIMFIRSR
jgi:fatty acid-binding protein DegV